MSLSLIGIIFVQGYYINNTVKNEEQQFTFKVKKVLSYASKEIEDNEYRKYVHELNRIFALGGVPDTTALRSITVAKQDDNTNQIIIYNTGILEENFRIPSLIDISLDSINFSKFTGKTFPVSLVRIKKFCADTTIAVEKLEKTGFVPPFTLNKGIEMFLNHEFPSKN